MFSILGITLDIVFFTDFAKNFISTYVDDEYQREVFELKRIFLNYWKGKKLLKDFVLAFPFGIVIAAGGYSVRHLLMLRMIRVLKMNAVYANLRISDRLKIKLKIVQYFYVLFLVSHIACCYFFEIISTFGSDITWRNPGMDIHSQYDDYNDLITSKKYMVAVYYASIMLHR